MYTGLETTISKQNITLITLVKYKDPRSLSGIRLHY